MKTTAETKKAISLILIYLALLFFLIGMAARAMGTLESSWSMGIADLSPSQPSSYACTKPGAPEFAILIDGAAGTVIARSVT